MATTTDTATTAYAELDDDRYEEMAVCCCFTSKVLRKRGYMEWVNKKSVLEDVDGEQAESAETRWEKEKREKREAKAERQLEKKKLEREKKKGKRRTWVPMNAVGEDADARAINHESVKRDMLTNSALNPEEDRISGMRPPSILQTPSAAAPPWFKSHEGYVDIDSAAPTEVDKSLEHAHYG
jgi:hypothetical protein